MATPGMLTITKAGRVAMKIVAGRNGYNVDALAMLIRPLLIDGRVPPIDEVWQRAIMANFGGPSDLAVITEPDVFFANGLDRVREDHPNPVYSGTFNDPQFNPRTCGGTTENIRVMEINECRRRPERRRITRVPERRKITGRPPHLSHAYSETVSCVLIENLLPFGEAQAMSLRPNSI